MYLRVLATADSKREEVVKVEEGVWRISVREPAQGNRANNRIRELVARELSLPVGKVRLLAGHRSRSKMISVDLEYV